MLVASKLPVTTSQAEFLSNGHNKEQFISLLVAELEKYGIATDKAIGDADTLIVWTGLNAAYQCPNTRVYVIGTDTDLLVLLMGRRELVPCNLYMNFDKTYEMKNGKLTKIYKSVNIQGLQNQKSFSSIRHYIPVLHAISGCDTTSSIYNQGKRTIVQKAQTKQHLQAHMDVFLKYSTPEEVAEAGEKIILSLYTAEKQFKTLDNYRGPAYKRAVKNVKVSSQFKLERLPPTTEAARQHSLRTYLQVQTWLGNTTLSPLDWDWKLCSDILVPHRTEKPVAHPNLLNMISCGCKKGCKASCTCRKMGMLCTDMCANSSELGCTNSSLLEEDTESDVHPILSQNQEIELDEDTQIMNDPGEMEIPLDQDADLSISSVFYDSVTMF